VPWRAVGSISLEGARAGELSALVLVLVPAKGRPAVLRLYDRYELPLLELAARLEELRRAAVAAPREADAGADALGEPDRGRAIDAYAYSEACAGRELPPGTFVVRARNGRSVGVLLTPAALLVTEGDAYRRVPWRHIARVELGSANPYEFIPSDILVARDGAGRALALVPCRPLGMAPDDVFELVGRYLYEVNALGAAA
jgi:hypothetical protein